MHAPPPLLLLGRAQDSWRRPGPATVMTILVNSSAASTAYYYWCRPDLASVFPGQRDFWTPFGLTASQDWSHANAPLLRNPPFLVILLYQKLQKEVKGRTKLSLKKSNSSSSIFFRLVLFILLRLHTREIHLKLRDALKKYEVTIHKLPHLKYISLVSVRSSHLPFKTR